MNLTKRRIDAASYSESEARRQVLWDDRLPGFGLRLNPAGSKSFVLKYRMPGDSRTRLHALGRYGPMTLDQARAKAKAISVEVSGGEDPARRRRQPIPTFGDFAATYIEDHAKPRKKTWREDVRRLNKYLLPKWRRYRLDAVTRADVTRLHNEIGRKHATEANRVLALVSVVFTRAAEWDLLPAGTANPARRVKPFPEQSRERWVQPHELPRLLEAIEAEENPWYRGIFLLYLFTGARRSELTRLRWQDVDLEGRTLHLPETKAGRSHRIPLSDPAVRILEELPREFGSPYVFPGAGKSGHMSDLKRPWKRVRERAGLGDVRLHDLRRTVGSLLALDGTSLQMIGRILNHSETKTTEIYARLTDDAARKTLERHAENVVSLAQWKDRHVG